MNPKIKVLIVDDHVVVREGTELLLSDADHIQVVGKASDGEEALRLLQALEPDVVLLDLLMPGPRAEDVIREALKIRPEVRVLLVSGSEERDQVLAAIRAGGTGFLSKSSDPREYIRAIERLYRGGSFLTSEMTRELLREPGDADPALAALTEREREILRLVALGWDNHRIAEKLHIAEVTARTHLSRLLAKIGSANRVEAVHFALKHGLASLDEITNKD